MKERRNADDAARACERSDALVAYLYGEASTAEAADVRRHLSACAVCREEAAAFGDVRARLGEWRDEALRAAPSLIPSEVSAPAASMNVPAVIHARAPRQRSALAALREFFALSPRWLQAGALAATLAVCALAALTVARAEVRWGADGFALRTGVARGAVERPVATPAANVYTKEQVEALTSERVNHALEAARREWEAQRASEQLAAAEKQAEKRDAPRIEVANAKPQPRKRTAPRQTRRSERDLEDDENLPRLSDLLSGIY
jgi:hypothetical protein